MSDTAAGGQREPIGPGTLLAGKYRVTRRLGDGSMGVVYAGLHERLGREVAIKVLLNMAMVAGDTLVRGGRLDVGAEVHLDRTEIAVRATGDRLILDENIRKALTGQLPESELTPRVAAAWMAHQIATSSGGEIQVSEPDQPFLLFGATLIG